MTVLGPDSSALPLPLRESWRARSTGSVWLRPADWYHPAVDAVVEAVLADADPSAPAERLGEARGYDGVGITESIDDLACLFRTIGVPTPPLPVVRALCEGWSNAQAGGFAPRSCVDAETGLPTREYLGTRLAETYGRAERADTFAQITHSLLMVDVAVAELTPWARIARSAAVGEALRSAFGEGHPMATLGGGLFVVLVHRDAGFTSTLATVRAHMAHQADRLGVDDLLRQPPRVWSEQLPRTHARAVQVLAELSR